MPFRFRPHRACFADAIAEMQTFDSVAALQAHLSSPIVGQSESVCDDRVPWQAPTFMVMVQGTKRDDWVAGMVDARLPDVPEWTKHPS